MMNKNRPQEENAMDPYTKDMLAHGISRRSFLTRSAAGAAGVGMLALGGPAAEAANPAADKSADFARSSDGGATLAFLPKPKPIADKDIKETLTFDVVVVGAGQVDGKTFAGEHRGHVFQLRDQRLELFGVDGKCGGDVAGGSQEPGEATITGAERLAHPEP
mgnify:CR=1 FL=1